MSDQNRATQTQVPASEENGALKLPPVSKDLIAGVAAQLKNPSDLDAAIAKAVPLPPEKRAVPKQASMADYFSAAKLIGCDSFTFRAVCLVESMGHGFDAAGFPVCLYEPHIAWAHASVAERIALGKVGLAYPKWGTLPYGSYAAQKARWKQASAIAGIELATLATSWGLTQILGENFMDCGYNNPTDFLTSQMTSEASQLHDTALLMRSMSGMMAAMQRTNFQAIARCWNGPGQVAIYAAKIAAARAALIKTYKVENTRVDFLWGAEGTAVPTDTVVAGALPPNLALTELLERTTPPRGEGYNGYLYPQLDGSVSIWTKIRMALGL